MPVATSIWRGALARAAQDRGEDRPSVVLAVSGQTPEAAFTGHPAEAG